MPGATTSSIDSDGQVIRCLHLLHAYLPIYRILTRHDQRRSETQDRLRQIINKGQCHEEELRSLQRNVRILQQSLDSATPSPNLPCQIESVLENAISALKVTIHSRILEGLRFENMTDRFCEVENAHDNTFDWILRPTTMDKQDEEQTDSDGGTDEDDDGRDNNDAYSSNHGVLRPHMRLGSQIRHIGRA